MRSEELANAYDAYAPGLYSYCRSVLRQAADAADAVHSTFLIAAEKSDQLRDQSRLRPWLYAIARNECIRIYRSREIPVEQPPEASAEVTSMTASSDREYLCALVRDAALGVNPAEREVLYLQLQGLRPSEQAITLGISRRHLSSLSSRAKSQLEDSISALLVARNGRQDCGKLESMLTDWDGSLSPALRKRLTRHIGNCAVCGVRKRREMNPGILGAVIPMAFAVPLALRDHVLDAATSAAPHAVARRAVAARRAGPFGRDGFPRRLPTSYRALRSRTLTASAAGTLIGGAIATGLALGGGSGTTHLPIIYPPQPTSSSASARPTVERHPAAGTPSPGKTHGRPGAVPSSSSTRSPWHNGGTTYGSPSPVPTGTPTVTYTTTVTATTKAPSPGPTPSPTQTVTVTAPAPSPTPAPTRGSAAQGTLTVSPTTIVVTPLLGSSFTITASGGPVSWSVSASAGLLGSVSVSPSSGTLQAGQSVTVSVNTATLLSVASTLTVEPGNIKITVVAGTGLLGL